MFAAQSSRSERVTKSELEGTRPAGTEEFPRRVKGVIETRRVNGIVAPRVVPVGRATDVRYVKHVEPFRDELQRVRSVKWNGLQSRACRLQARCRERVRQCCRLRDTWAARYTP